MCVCVCGGGGGGGGDTYNIRIQGCACHIFWSEIQLVTHILGTKFYLRTSHGLNVFHRLPFFRVLLLKIPG